MFSWYCGLFHVTCAVVFVSVSTSVIIKTETEVSNERKTTAVAIMWHQCIILTTVPFSDVTITSHVSDHFQNENNNKTTSEYLFPCMQDKY